MEKDQVSFDQLHNNVKETHRTEIMLPDQNGTLCQWSKLCINDRNLDATETSNVVHDIVSHEVAKLLGVITKKRQDLQSHIKTRNFGQKEELTKRIERILSGYPPDDGIFKELLQNADDAGASEIHFVTDFKHHPSNMIFNEQWKSLQGPALLVFNDSEFTEKDIEGIQQLGTGSKGSDATKTGQFGVGFNVVYHLTDVPSFITKGPNIEETLCVLDPNRLYVDPKDKSDTGIQYCDLHDLRGDYEDVFVAYHEKALLNDQGTIFRFPLRTFDMAKKSNISKEAIDENGIGKLLAEFKSSAFECLLFLKNLRKITISDISSNILKKTYEVNSSFSKDDDIIVSEYLQEVNSLKDDIQFRGKYKPKEAQYVITVADNENRSESFLIVQRCGYETPIHPTIMEAIGNNNLNLLPLGGIAVPVQLREQKEILPWVTNKCSTRGHQAFCFLPLPVDTGLPFHVNGHFALDHEARRTLWQDVNQDFKSLWNKTILEHVIAPCFSTILLTFKESIETYVITNDSCSRSRSVLSLNCYNSLFPEYSRAKDDNWKTLVSAIYRAILDAEIEIFPSLLPSCETRQRSTEEQKILFKFISKKKKSQTFESVSISGCEWSLVQIVKKIGLEVLDSPYSVLKSIQDADNTIQHLTPKYLLEFLKSHRMEEDYRCNIVITGNKVDIRNTRIEKPDHLIELYSYCAQIEHFEEEIDGLPLCLTQDSQLQPFRKNARHFCCEFADILPQSADAFLHTKFVLETVPDSVKHPFTLDDFVRLLPNTLDYEKFHSGNYFTISNDIPDKKWLKRVWKFIDTKTGSGERDRQNIKDLLIQRLGSWCLLPCKRKRKQLQYEESEEILLPVQRIDEILATSSFTGETKRAFEKLNFPVLNDDCLSSVTVLAKVISGSMHPFDVLCCLYCHRRNMEEMTVSTDDCDTVMAYISNNIQTILKDLGEDEIQRVVDRIKALPLHVTVYGETTSLDNGCNVLVLPLGMPDSGVSTWASKSRTILLRQSDNLQSLHNLLRCSVSSQCEVYSCHILPKIASLPCQHYVRHMQFIRTNLLRSSGGDYDDEQKQLIAILRDTPFIGHTKRKASSFYSKKITLFEMMCEECDVLPEPYCNQEWQNFMESIGLKTSIPNDLFIEFAKTVASDGMRNMTDSTNKKSEELLQELLTRADTSEKSFLKTVSTIRFVVPHGARKVHNDIFPQYEKGKLISFASSISSQFENLAWTTCHILPLSKIDLRTLPSELGFQNKPSLTQVIQNLQNVSSSLKQMLEKSKDALPYKTVVDILSVMFKFLEEHTEDPALLKRMLDHAPIVYLPNEKKMVACYQIVIGLYDSEVIKPHLYEAPTVFGPFFCLFQKLGTTKKTSYRTYARILKEVHMTLQDNEFHVNELMMISKVVRRFFLELRFVFEEDDLQDIGADTLYLPTDKRTLCKASQVIIADVSKSVSVNDIEGFQFLLEFDWDFLRNGQDDLKKIINNLPERHRPRLLSDHMKREVYFVKMEIQTVAETIQDFIISQEFIDGYIRLITGRAVGQSAENKPINRDKVVADLKRVTVIQVRELKTRYTHKGKYIAEKDLHCWYETENHGEHSEWKCYMKYYPGEDITTVISRIDIRLCKCISKCTGHISLRNDSLLVKILAAIRQPSSISKLLDDNNIKDDCVRRNTLPCKLGEFVEPKWHHMLINRFCEFEIDEYVAVLANEDEEEGVHENDVYIYAQIKKKLEDGDSREGLRVKYKVKVGAFKCVIKYAYELFKFSRQTDNDSSEIVPMVDVDNIAGMKQDSSLEEIRREIIKNLNAAWTLSEKERKSVIKRILKTWHPDKNLGQEERATEVFKFIKNTVRILERDGVIKMDDDEPDIRTSTMPQPSHSYYDTMFDNVDKQCRREREYYESHRSNKSRTPSVPEPVPHPGKARKWYRQACCDFTAAKDHFNKADNGKSYNWICYMCHQAAEKSLIAVMYNTDANNVSKSDDLTLLSFMTNAELKDFARELQAITGSASAMRYPDETQIPAESYTKEQAEQAMSVCEKILHKVDEDL